MSWSPAHLLACIALVLALGATHARAEGAAAGGLPEIAAHSKLAVAVYKGDRLALEVQAKGDGLEPRWFTQQATLCRALACEIDTHDWDLGTQVLTFVVFNGRGSLFLRFSVRVLAPPAGYKPRTVRPELVEANDAPETPGVEDPSCAR
jgi:hypothetical protein